MTNKVVHIRETTGFCDPNERCSLAKDQVMRSSTFKVAEARAKFSEILARANAGEEIVIIKGREPHARILPPRRHKDRETAPLKHLRLSDDIFDQEDSEQATIDAGDFSDELGIWRDRSSGL